MLILREKQFGNNEERVFVGQAGFFIRELIKILLMGDKCKQDIPHWLDNAVGAIVKASSKYKSIRISSNISLFLGLFNSGASDRSLAAITKNEINGVGLPYLKDQIKEVYNQRERGQYKYRHLINLPSIDCGLLMSQLKYIALCMSGQISPDTVDFYSSMHKIDGISLNFNATTTGNTRLLLEKIFREQFFIEW